MKLREFRWICLAVLAVLAFGRATFAQAPVDLNSAYEEDESHEGLECKAFKKAPAVFFKSNQDCLSHAPQCHIPPYIHDPSVPFWPVLMDYTPLVKLNLPDGDFLVTAKLSAYPDGGAAWVIFECALYRDPYDPMAPATDYSSFDGFFQQTLFFQTPVSLRTGSGGTMTVGCRATGYKDYWGGDQQVDMLVWNVSIAATRVCSVTTE